MQTRSMFQLSVSLLSASLVLGAARPAPAQTRAVNYDESKISAYVLPDPLVLANGQKVADAETWVKQRRPEVFRLFESQMFGRSPGRPGAMKFEVTGLDPRALGGKATRKQVSVYFTGKKEGPRMDLLIYLPNQAAKPVPAFLGPNFEGNQGVHDDPGIRPAQVWTRLGKEGDLVSYRATDFSRGKESERWQVEKVLARGYALATVFYGDVEPDFADGWKWGVRAALSKAGAQTQFKPDDWGAIGAWAWGLSRALDYLETDKDIDARHVAVIGHSRLGKTALWAGARDERFAIVISNDSGEGGAALARRNFGETTAVINRAFPHWFCGNFKQYGDREETLPMDQHELIALMAPRPVYVASAEEDRWADPRGEFLACKNAEPVYRLFGKAGLGVADWPAVNQPVGDWIGYHVRTGKHDVTAYDWDQYLNFADRHFKRGANR
ncbi:MAG: acetylxylan esterase [Verrucomicrobia bacterium]|nr:acetylxylan esterase [Verrucomicrobiota bacterium]